MPSDSGAGMPGFFIAFFIFVVLLAIGTSIWKVSAARRMAADAGLDPNRAAAVTMLSNDGLGAAYLASTMSSGANTQPTRTTEQRLHDLLALKDKGLVSDDEYEASRQKILGSI